MELLVYAIIFSAAMVAAMVVCDRLLDKQLRENPHPTRIREGSLLHLEAGEPSQHAAIAESGHDQARTLRPAEIGYLMRNGDRNHALLVMVVDLIQRRVKQQEEQSSIPQLAPYEAQMWTNVKESLKVWAQKKIDSVLPDVRKNPARFVKRLARIYDFCQGSLKVILKDVIQDPRQLKRYFKVHGILRLISDFTLAGYQGAFEEELKKDLIARGLLVTEERRARFAKLYFLLFLAGWALSLTATIFLCGSMMTGIISCVIVSGTGFLLRALMELQALIPYFEETQDLLKTLQRADWRIRLVSSVLRLIRALFIVVMISSFFVVIALSYAFYFWTASGHAEALTTMVAMFIVVQFFLAHIAFKAWHLTVEERATERGEHLLELAQKRLAGLSPLECFKKLLTTSEYDPTFSEVMAVYGPETLILLG
ncbi:MAG TPA: hypothetical protein V6D17_11555 [Candidatus Obscuribacterales bacterium]